MPFVSVAGRAFCAATFSAVVLAAVPAQAQSAATWPDRPVKLVVPLGAGGPADLVGRFVGQALGERFKQSFFVENRPGAAGAIGTAEAAKAAPDGHTLLVVASPHINVEILNPNKPYQLLRDFSPVAALFSTDAIMVIHPKVPARTVKEFIALAKSQPGKLTYASSGPGSNKHLGGELFKLMSGTDILHVAYKGSTGARNDLLGGHVDMMFDEIPSSGPNVVAGQLRALGVTGAKRSTAFPDLPTISEAGVPGYEHTGWFGIMVPVGTPKAIIDTLAAELKAMTDKPEVQELWRKQGTEVMYKGPAEFKAFLHAEIDKWTKVVKAANIKLQ